MFLLTFVPKAMPWAVINQPFGLLKQTFLISALRSDFVFVTPTTCHLREARPLPVPAYQQAGMNLCLAYQKLTEKLIGFQARDSSLHFASFRMTGTLDSYHLSLLKNKDFLCYQVIFLVKTRSDLVIVYSLYCFFCIFCYIFVLPKFFH